MKYIINKYICGREAAQDQWITYFATQFDAEKVNRDK